jgi:thiamine-phosphate pyrophosphorylase
LLGASVSSLGEASDAAQAGVDYVTFGNVFETKSHPGQPGRGFELLRDVVDAVDVPVIAIGGVTADRVDSLVGSGATGISVIRAIGDASDPRKAAQELRNALDAAHRRKQ